MPLYDYDCAACGRRFELIHGVHAEPPTTCPLCGSGPIRKAIVAPVVHYKGSGWAKKERRATATSGPSSPSSDDKSGGDSEARPAAATSDVSSTDASSPSEKTSSSEPAPSKAPAASGD
ncbi:MAG: FmdB family zinc ribbon protein [Candidatus Limnocylindrales bacterium]